MVSRDSGESNVGMFVGSKSNIQRFECRRMVCRLMILVLKLEVECYGRERHLDHLYIDNLMDPQVPAFQGWVG